ncbi:MAG: hypothetical protein KUF72_13045 [Candidatus Thiodiazotropha sp. (ex Ctena orbiculata)]|nr:hypothetical protein [Candidatus Thiodiazotropha taylori]
MGMAQGQAPEESVPADREVLVRAASLDMVQVEPVRMDRVADQVQVGRNLPVPAQVDRV